LTAAAIITDIVLLIISVYATWNILGTLVNCEDVRLIVMVMELVKLMVFAFAVMAGWGQIATYELAMPHAVSMESVSIWD
jgi:hypothetical protein